MNNNPYKIQLGVYLDTKNLRTEINQLDDKYKLKLGSGRNQIPGL